MINKDEQDYVKAGNYWRWLKKKLASQEFQPVSHSRLQIPIYIELLVGNSTDPNFHWK